MFAGNSRRRFLKTTAAGAGLLGLGDLDFIARLPRVSAQEVKGGANIVQLRSEIEPLVRLLEETPRDRLLEEVAAKIKRGTSYREVLAALQLAGVRNIQPRPSVGFKFHAVLVVNSAHLASLASPDEHRWLPIFWALDYFKDSQAADIKENNWTMAPVDEARVPKADKARAAFIEAMDNWDVDAADAAVAGLARTAGADEVFELFYRYGSRDFRDIGHKAIFVANSRRTLQCIGWEHAEPILRSLAYALQHHDGGNPAKGDAAADKPIRTNRELAKKLRPDWAAGKLENSATTEFLSTLRSGSEADACQQAVEIVNRGVSPQSIWDALFLGAGELLMRQPGIVALHAMTSSNALRYAFNSSAEDTTRRELFLQNCAFVPLFRQAMASRGKVEEAKIEALEPADSLANGAAGVGEVFRDVGKDNGAAARKMLKALEQSSSPEEIMSAARVLVFLKGSNTHDYKFSAAVLEDFYQVSPAWRNRFLASSVYNLRGSAATDNKLVARTRAALGA